MKIRKCISIIILVAFFATSIKTPVYAQMAQDPMPRLPVPGVMVHLSPEFTPVIMRGMEVFKNDPLKFNFIVDGGDTAVNTADIQDDTKKLISYFLASLTIPEKDLWVNLSPYEKDRIIPEAFGQTTMGRDTLAQDYVLKQITASLIYPEEEIGKKFWKRVYEEAAKKFGTTNIPINTFNKVWILPDESVIYENAKTNSVFIVKSTLKVMLEEDYLAMQKQLSLTLSLTKEGGSSPLFYKEGIKGSSKDVNALGSQIVREVVIPELTKEVNEGRNFSTLRQLYSSLILATWYKQKLKNSILEKAYINKNKIVGVNVDDPDVKNKIYLKYLQAFKKGVYNYIKEETDPITNQIISRKYFSGGFRLTIDYLKKATAADASQTVAAQPPQRQFFEVIAEAGIQVTPGGALRKSFVHRTTDRWARQERGVRRVIGGLELALAVILAWGIWGAASSDTWPVPRPPVPGPTHTWIYSPADVPFRKISLPPNVPHLLVGSISARSDNYRVVADGTGERFQEQMVPLYVSVRLKVLKGREYINSGDTWATAIYTALSAGGVFYDRTYIETTPIQDDARRIVYQIQLPPVEQGTNIVPLLPILPGWGVSIVSSNGTEVKVKDGIVKSKITDWTTATVPLTVTLQPAEWGIKIPSKLGDPYLAEEFKTLSNNPTFKDLAKELREANGDIERVKKIVQQAMGRFMTHNEYYDTTIGENFIQMLSDIVNQETVARLKFYEVGSNGDTILSKLIKNGILEDVSSTEERLKANLEKNKDWIREIAGSDFDKIWDILKHPHKENIMSSQSNIGSLFAYILFKNAGIPAVFVHGWRQERGDEIDGDDTSHAILLIQVETGKWERFESTKYMAKPVPKSAPLASSTAPAGDIGKLTPYENPYRQPAAAEKGTSGQIIPGEILYDNKISVNSLSGVSTIPPHGWGLIKIAGFLGVNRNSVSEANKDFFKGDQLRGDARLNLPPGIRGVKLGEDLRKVIEALGVDEGRAETLNRQFKQTGIVYLIGEENERLEALGIPHDVLVGPIQFFKDSASISQIPKREGGINLEHVNLKITKEGLGVITSFDDPEQLALLMKSNGLSPIIYQIQPVTVSMVQDLINQ